MRTIIVTLAAGACLAAPLVLADPISAEYPTEATNIGINFDDNSRLPAPDKFFGTHHIDEIAQIGAFDQGYYISSPYIISYSFQIVATCAYQSGGDTCESNPAVSVPEPGTGLLLLSGLLLLAGRRLAV